MKVGGYLSVGSPVSLSFGYLIFELNNRLEEEKGILPFDSEAQGFDEDGNPYGIDNLPFAKGGKTQGYNDKLDESLGMRKRKKVQAIRASCLAMPVKKHLNLCLLLFITATKF